MRIDTAVNPAAEAFTPEVLWRILQRNKFDGAIAGGDLGWLREQRQRNPWILGLVAAGQTDDLEGCCAVALDASALTPEAIGEIAARGLALDLHLKPFELTQALQVAESHSDLHLAIAHMGQPSFGADFDVWARAMESLAAAPSIRIKISGLIHEADATGWDANLYRPYVQHLLQTFPIDRLMFGSDWPRCAAAWTWKQSLAAFTQALGPQTMETRELLLGENARTHYRLGND